MSKTVYDRPKNNHERCQKESTREKVSTKVFERKGVGESLREGVEEKSTKERVPEKVYERVWMKVMAARVSEKGYVWVSGKVCEKEGVGESYDRVSERVNREGVEESQRERGCRRKSTRVCRCIVFSILEFDDASFPIHNKLRQQNFSTWKIVSACQWDKIAGSF